jgi:hypothetical protein
MNKFFTVNVNPTFTYAQRNTVFSDGDVLVDWYAFDLPNGGNKLINAYMITEPPNGAAHQTHNPEVYFAKDLVVGGKIITPASLGIVDATALGGTYQSHIIGFLEGAGTGEVTTNLDYGFVQRLVTTPGKGIQDHIILQGEPNTGTSKGYSRLYVGIASTDGTPDFRCTVTTNGGGTAGDATLTVDTVSAFRVFSVGDELIDQDEQEIGTVESVHALGTLITLRSPGLLNSVATNKVIVAKSPMKLVLGFER